MSFPKVCKAIGSSIRLYVNDKSEVTALFTTCLTAKDLNDIERSWIITQPLSKYVPSKATLKIPLMEGY
ncbi:hypothetical protein [Pedobacter sp. MC2016-24]|uniref:hypothetical protein n=1 Tax=Pedobacter sp. MC2016-24 TaxID=2780090 RepID=UPI001882EA23|nr:hypothetical protein [Pedobacter sp. MC2016-24]MBE9601130.1 hypothetical protein [Pedobacter sp. MC2016-24]